jgi:hypothetical protein
MESYHLKKKINLKLKFSPFEIRKARIKMSTAKSLKKFTPMEGFQTMLIVGGATVCTGAGSKTLPDGEVFKYSTDAKYDNGNNSYSSADKDYGCNPVRSTISTISEKIIIGFAIGS